MLRNFPHQINQLDKLHAALACIADLINAGQDPADDGILGYECARRGVYAFRGLSKPTQGRLEQRIVVEQRKSASNQGPRTFARDLRRTLQTMGLLHIEGTNVELSPIGERLLAFASGSHEAEYIELWRDAILRITLPPARGTKENLRPAPIMLRLVGDNPGIVKNWLMLAFETRSNSKQEYRRIDRLRRIGNLTNVLRKIRATNYQANNSVKIIPALLEQVGLLTIRNGVCELTAAGQGYLQGRPRVVPASRPQRTGHPRRRSIRPPESNVSSPNDIPLRPASARRPTSPEAMAQALDALGIRTQEHQQLLRQLVANLRNLSDISATPDKYDLFGKSVLRDQVVIFEVKTGENYLLQARLALGQLCQYEFLDIRPHLQPSTKVLRVVIFGEEPGQTVRDFLSAYGVLVVVRAAGAFIVPAELTDYFVPPS